MVEEIEVHVQPADEAGTHGAQAIQPFGGLVQKLVLASIGAIAQTRDETEAFVSRLAERGAMAQKDSQQLLQEVATRMQPRSSMERMEAQFETRFEQFLNRLNIPSKRDIDDLSAKIAQLAARVEERQEHKT